jgi:hypothetical protein
MLVFTLAIGLTVGWAAEAGAQANHPGSAGRYALERGMLYTSVTNLGTQGGSIGAALSRASSMVYPATVGSDLITGDSWASQLPNFRVDCNSEGRIESTSHGEGIGLALKVPASFPVYADFSKDGYYVVLSGPRSDMLDEIVPMYQDPSEDDDLKYLGGEPRVRPSSAEEAGADWRQGLPYYYPSNWAEEVLPQKLDKEPLSRRPVVIDNWRFGEYQTAGPPAAPSSRSDEWAEEIVLTKWTTLAGVTFTRRHMTWSYPAFDDFILVEIEFENTGDSDGDGVRDLAEETLDEVYIPMMGCWMLTDAGLCHYNRSDRWHWYNAGGLDDWIVYSENAGYAGPAAGLKMIVDWDGDSPEFPWDDTGDPVNTLIISPSCDTGRKEGEFCSYQYMGFGPLAYEDGGTWGFNTRDAGKFVQPTGDQPHAVRFFRIEGETVSDDPRPNAHDRKAMYDMVAGSGFDANPSSMGVFYSTQTFGPYTLAPGDKGKLVVAWVGGSGAGEDDLYTWTRTTRNDQGELAKGETWMAEFFTRAKWAYDNEYDLPDAPPDVYAVVTNSPDATNRLNWSSASNAVNPDYGVADVAGYRIYRSEWNPDGPWSQVGEVSSATTTFTDTASVAGFNYWYSVRSYASGHADWAGRVGTMATLPAKVQAQVQAGLEGGQWARAQRKPKFFSPKQPAVSQTENLAREVFVVPNPFRVGDANLQYPGKTQIRFVNVPSLCWIYVFNSAGDMVAQIKHDDRTDNPNNPEVWLGEAQWDQLAMSLGTGAIPSGIYFYVVESLVPGQEGKMKNGKFMVIR